MDSGKNWEQKIKPLMPVVSLIFIGIITFVFSMQCSPNIWNNGEAGKDSSVFRTVALMMERGYAPYRDTFDHKGPLMYILNWLGMQIAYYRGIWVIEYITLFITFAFMYKIIRLFCRRWISYIMVLVAVAALYPQFEGGNLTEEYAMPFIAVSLYFFTKYLLTSSIPSLQVLICGICFGAVCLLRPNMVASWGVFSIVVLVKCLRERQYKEIGKFLLLFLAGTGIIVLPILAWMYREDALGDCIYDYILFNLRYSEVGTQQRGDQVMAFFYFISVPLLLCFLVLAANLFLYKKKDYLTIGYGICLLVNLFAISISGKKFAHYAMILIPLYAYPLGILGEWIDKTIQRKEKVVSARILLCFLAILALPGWAVGVKDTIVSYMDRNKNTWSEATASTVNYITEHTEENEKITVWGNWDLIHVLSRRLPASRYSFQASIGVVDPGIYDEYFSELAAEEPSLIIVKEDGTEEPMMDFIEEHGYQQVFENVSNATVYIYSK
ncbi:MAG TPA: hypothetical protein H9717_11495 [Candidatus Eisenbergiella merdipullorum]|uniref:Glycosyltransferase RgtA/B/C/D-like domain-containing protein n=1 Tax=Candidatus Eisenbergiella merdipullorum TaxID=2838553 RepID=A0A9D2I6N1_9FIRM|nr:hypothetical protein [Candidatus Eisenbergiella merdipullorum]